ncbi:GtrA family protein [Sedimentimonas flavescens]|uniref:GtrA family protein n=1 Tax=Sedimentimonas flavescens TaxID=2851012 RepID=UPI001C4A3F77|nr:GtrA family protein [Sedimentimonas flavescens]
MVGQLIRFGGVGGIATLVHVLMAMALQGPLALPPLQANFGGFCAALLISYIGHARITFDADLRHAPQFVRFVTIALIGLATSSTTVWLIDTRLGAGFGIAMAAVAVLVPLMTFVTLRLWVFTGRANREQIDVQDLALSAALALGMLALFWGRMINHDTAWYLLATRKWLAGAQLYVDLIEVNPPLNFYLTVPPLALADLLGLSDTNGQYLWLALLIFVSLSWSGSILKAGLGMTARPRAFLMIGMAAAMILPALNNMGQRDQMLVILMMPWVLGQIAPQPQARGPQIARAAFAAFGICLKPHFILFPFTATLFEIVRQRSLRPILSAGNITFLVLGSAYVAIVALLHPAYLQEIVPIAREVYGAYGAPLVYVAFNFRNEALALLIVVLVARLTVRTNPAVGLLIVLCFAGAASYLLQGTGFGYHKIPFLAFLLIAYAWILASVSYKTLVTIAVCALPLVPMAGLYKRGFYNNRALTEITKVDLAWSEFDSIMALTTHLDVGPAAAFEIGADWVSRYPVSWLVPGAVNRLRDLDCKTEAAVCAKLTEIVARNRSDNIEDVTLNDPELLIIDKQSRFFDRPGFDWLAFMAEDPAWEAVFATYRLAASGDHFDYYLYAPQPAVN